MMTITMKQGKGKSKGKDKWNYHVYLRKFGLEFLEFLCKSHDIILYTSMERELTTTIVDAFRSIKKFINFSYIIWGKPFVKSIYRLSRPVKSLDNIIPLESKEKFLILDSESLSYLENYEDIFIPMLPICPLGNGASSGWKTSHHPGRRRMRASKVHRRQSSLKWFAESEDSVDIQTNLNNPCLFYLKQLLTQSFGLQHTNSELLKSVSIHNLTLERI